MENLKANEVSSEIEGAEKILNEWDPEYFKFWSKSKILPVKWVQKQYDNAGDFWVIALIGKNCLYYNHIEEGWGWGSYKEYGEISGFHWQQDEIQHAIYQMIFNIIN